MLVSPEALSQSLAGAGAAGLPVIFDCRFDLGDPDAGRRAWRTGRLPGAVYAHLDDDLAAPVTPATGRHPLPDAAGFAAFLARSGWSPGRDIVAYDAQGGAFAARLWWLMRYFGHDCVTLLDGGWPAWVEAGLPVETGEPGVPESAPLTALEARQGMTLDAGQVAAGLSNGSVLLVDARAPDRFAGRNETIDPVAGHVPGAVNLPFAGNLDQGRFRSADALAARFDEVLQGRDAGATVHMCGSGVTACHNLFAMALAGSGDARLYPGSWSEWIRDPARPVAAG